ncbi:MAG: CotH kinase family protein [Bacteroidales bacterium]|nr:CotH kinase family protein [Bacteroidales bacterium]
MTNRLLQLLVLLLATVYSSGQTYSGSGGILTNDGTTNYYPVTVSNLEQPSLGPIYGVETICIKITHTYVAELEVKLVSPDGLQILLTNGNGGSGDNYYTTYFNDFASTSIKNGSAPFDGTYKPEELIGEVNNGQNGNGVWQLTVKDLVPNNNFTGYMVGWSISFGYTPGPYFQFHSSNLPIVVINTHGQVIQDDPKIPVDMAIIDNGPGVRNFLTDTAAFEGIIGIEVRGSSSQSFPKKSYGFETWDIFGQSIDTSLLGMPAESDWILNANYTDKTLCRNVMAYQTWMNMGHYATRYKFAEVVINGEYLGVYIFSEKIKRDNDRVDIAKLLPEEVSGDELTGGYILKVDKSTGSGGDGWVSPFPPPVNPDGQMIFIQYEYPHSEDIVPEQKEYIKDYVTTFESVLEGPYFTDTAIGYRKYAEEITFIDYFIVNEISKNVDGYRLSTYFHKEKESKGGKIRMGPVWDYDIAWHNADYCEGDLHTGWAYQFPCAYDYWQVPFWWGRLLQDPLYASHLKCRWLDMRASSLSNQHITFYIDSLALQLNEAQFRNFIKWPILGVYVWPNPWPYPATYAEEILTLKNWVLNRLSWLDEHMPGTCYTIGEQDLAEDKTEIEIYPNPATSSLTIGYSQVRSGKVSLELFSQEGSSVLTFEENRPAGFHTEQLDISKQSPGVYLLKMSVNGSIIYRKIVKI